MAENVRLRDIPGANYRDDELGVIHQKGLKELLEALTLGKKGQAYDLDSGRWPEMIGEAVTVGEMEWVITAASRENQITQESGEALQGDFMVVDFDLSNNSNEQVRLYPSSL